MNGGGFGKSRMRRGGGNWRDRNDQSALPVTETPAGGKEIPDTEVQSDGIMQEDFERRLSHQQLDFSDAVLVEIRCADFVMQQAKFVNSSLNDVVLKDADLRGCDFSSAELIACMFDDVDLEHSRFHDAAASKLKVRNANLKSAKLSQADFSQASFADVDLSGACFDGSDLSEAAFVDANLSNVSFQDASLHKVLFKEVYFDHTEFASSDLEGARFENCEGTMRIDGKTVTAEDLS